MDLDITWTITAIIAVSSFLSPIAVAIINNMYHTKIRKIELEHDEHLRQMDLRHQSFIRQADIYYADKKSAFLEFSHEAGIFSMGKQNPSDYGSLHAAIDKALLFCNSENQNRLCSFQDYINSEVFAGGFSEKERVFYSSTLNGISIALNKELESTKPVIDCESSKC